MKKVLLFTLTGLTLYTASLVAPATVPAVQAQEQEQGDNKPRVRRSQTLRPQIYKKLDAVRELADQKRYDEALAELASVEKIKRNSYEQAMTHNMAAYVYFNQENYPAAIKAYGQVVAINSIPESLEQSTLYSLAKLHLIGEDYQQALKTLNQWFAVVDKPGAEAFILRAQMQFQLEQYSQARPDVKQAIGMTKAQGQQPKENWLLLERAVYYQNKDFDSLARCLQDLATLYPKPQYWVQLAAVYSELNRPLKELSALETAYEQNMLHKEAELVNLAQALLAQDIPYKAAQVLSTALQNEQIKPSARNLSLLGDAWMLAKEYDQAIAVMSQAAATSQQGSDYYKLAQIHTERQEWPDALTTVNKALQLGGLAQEHQALILKGLVLFNLNDLNAARSSFELASRMPEAEKTAAQWLNYLNTEQQRREYMASVE